jgi:hypothetical protein
VCWQYRCAQGRLQEEKLVQAGAYMGVVSQRLVLVGRSSTIQHEAFVISDLVWQRLSGTASTVHVINPPDACHE